MNKLIIAFIFPVIVLLGCVSKNSRGFAPTPKLEKSIISDICFNGKTASQISSNEVASLLRQTEKLYSDKSYRETHAQEFVVALENVIAHTEFKYLLQCKADWEKSKAHRFRVAFPESLKNMELAYFEEKGVHGENLQGLEVHMWLKTSVQQVLPTYMHELLHVCQYETTTGLQNQFDRGYAKLNQNEKWTVARRMWNEQGKAPEHFQPVNSKSVVEAEELYRAINRKRMLNEISAMQLMRNAYEHFVQLDPGYCEEDTVPDEHKKGLALAYAISTDELNSGIFAQRVLAWYSAHQLEGLFQANSDAISYPASNNGSAFKLKRLDPVFKSQIEALGIPVRERN